MQLPSYALTLVPLVCLFTAGVSSTADQLINDSRTTTGRGETASLHLLGLLVAVTGARFLDLCDPDEAADRDGGWRKG